MKRSWLITILFCLLLLGGGGAVLILPQVVPFSQCSDVYKRYAKMDGVDATFIKDYKVNDTVFVDVTLLKAKTDSAWNVNSSIEFNLISKEDPKKIDEDIDNNDVLVLSRQKHSVCVFHTNNKIQRNAIIRNKLDEI